MAALTRPFLEDDAPAVADLMRRTVPGYLVTAERLLHWRRSAPQGAEFHDWVAEDDRQIVAYANAFFQWWLEPGIAEPWVLVAPESRRRGIGAHLYEQAEHDLVERGAWKLKTNAFDDDGRRFASRRGYAETRRERLSELDVRAADVSELDQLEAVKAAEGYAIAPLRQLRERETELHALYLEAAKDMPGDDPHREVELEQWRRDTLEDPLLDLDGSMNVVEGGRPVAFAWIVSDREGRRAEHELTGTLRADRGRGLARLAKLAVVRWCRENGIDTLLTGNDSANAHMLAINDRLGYVPSVVHTEVAKVLRAQPATR